MLALHTNVREHSLTTLRTHVCTHVSASQAPRRAAVPHEPLLRHRGGGRGAHGGAGGSCGRIPSRCVSETQNGRPLTTPAARITTPRTTHRPGACRPAPYLSGAQHMTNCPLHHPTSRCPPRSIARPPQRPHPPPQPQPPARSPRLRTRRRRRRRHPARHPLAPHQAAQHSLGQRVRRRRCQAVRLTVVRQWQGFGRGGGPGPSEPRGAVAPSRQRGCAGGGRGGARGGRGECHGRAAGPKLGVSAGA